MTRLPELAHDSGDDYRRFFTPTPSLPEELARPRISIAQGCPDATAWDEDDSWFRVSGTYYSDPGALHTAQTIKAERELREVCRFVRGTLRAIPRYWPSVEVCKDAAVVEGRLVATDRYHRALTPDEVNALRETGIVLYREQRAEYLAAWSPTIPDSERAA